MSFRDRLSQCVPFKISSGLHYIKKYFQIGESPFRIWDTGTTGLYGELYTVDKVPVHFHERFIVRGYRHPQSSAKQCALSLFDATNETLNFWTHFFSTCYFMWILKTLNETYDFRHNSYSWPLLTYAFTTTLCPIVSSVAHTFNTMSVKARHICFFMDYAALSMMSLGLSFAARAYFFPSNLRETWYGTVYLPVAFVAAIFCTLTSCETRFMKPSGKRQVLRLGAFALPYIANSAPILYRLVLGTPDDMALQSSINHYCHFLFTFLAAFLYATHFPERIWPGRFDIVGQSHQIFHICTTLASRESLLGALKDMEERKTSLQHHWEFDRVYSTVGIMGLLMVVNVLIVAGFSLRLNKFIKEKE